MMKSAPLLSPHSLRSGQALSTFAPLSVNSAKGLSRSAQRCFATLSMTGLCLSVGEELSSSFEPCLNKNPHWQTGSARHRWRVLCLFLSQYPWTKRQSGFLHFKTLAACYFFSITTTRQSLPVHLGGAHLRFLCRFLLSPFS